MGPPVGLKKFGCANSMLSDTLFGADTLRKLGVSSGPLAVSWGLLGYPGISWGSPRILLLVSLGVTPWEAPQGLCYPDSPTSKRLVHVFSGFYIQIRRRIDPESIRNTPRIPPG